MTTTRTLLLLLGLAVAAGCKDGLGDRCQVSSDCDDGLVCVLPVGGTPQSGGVCETAEGPDMMAGELGPLADLATPPDQSPVD